MTKSPLAFAREALEAARVALPPYSSKYSRKDFTQHQLFAVLALMIFLKTDYRGIEVQLSEWSDLRDVLGLSKAPDYSTLQKFLTRLKKKYTDALLTATLAALGPVPVRAAVDSTGYDARPVSRYFAACHGRPGRQKRWPKLTAVVDTRTHLFLAASVTRGPRQDAPQLIPAVRQAVRRTPIDTLLADAGYDSEANHATCREKLGIRSTVIALNWRGSRKWPAAKYRRQMVRRFRKKPSGSRHRRVYGQRAHAESVFSRNKRRLGASVAATKWANQKSVILLKVLTHNLMLLATQRVST
jgi:transposase